MPLTVFHGVSADSTQHDEKLLAILVSFVSIYQQMQPQKTYDGVSGMAKTLYNRSWPSPTYAEEP